MTPNAVVLSLLFKSLDEPDVLPVLGDAIMEYGFQLPTRVVRNAFELVYARIGFDERITTEWLHANAASPTPTFTRALAAALLCDEWQTEPWFPVTPRQIRMAIESRLAQYEQMGLIVGTDPAVPFIRTAEEFAEFTGQLMSRADADAFSYATRPGLYVQIAHPEPEDE